MTRELCQNTLWADRFLTSRYLLHDNLYMKGYLRGRSRVFSLNRENDICKDTITTIILDRCNG